VSGLSFPRLVTSLLFGAIFLTACLMPAQSDTYWHLRAGQELWATHHVPLVERYSHTAAGVFWPNHEWLWQAASFGLYRVGGFPLLLVAAATVVTAAFGLTYRLMVGSPITRFGLMLLGMPLSASVWALRPQIVSLALLAVLLTLIAHERTRWLPALFVLWANVHGAVALGGVVLVAVTAAAVWRARAGDATDDDRRRVRELLIVTPLCALATAATPLGFRLWSFVLESTERSRQARIDEWLPATPTRPMEIAFWILAIGFVGLLIRRRRVLRAWPDLALVVATIAILPLAIRASRNIAPFLLAAIPATSRLLGADFRLGRSASGARADGDRPRLNLTLLIGFAAIGIGAVGTAWAASVPRLGWHPISAGALAAVRTCPGPLYNRYNEGGYLIWFAPDKPVFIDSRQDPYPPGFVLDAIGVEDEGRYEPVFARHGIRCALLPVASPTRPRLQAAGWRTRFSDDQWSVLGAPDPG
jgi:hypothetical protein